jgi:DNA-binding transcriptional LysR family regulator
VIDPLSLAYFSAVARDCSLNRAAKGLRASQPAVSRRIQQLEHDMGASLFLRSSTGVSLTPAGQALLRYSDELQRLTDEACTVVKQFSGKKKEVRIGFYQPAAPVLAPILHRLRTQHPAISVFPSELVPAALIDALRMGTIDLALPGFAQRELLTEFSGVRIPSAALTFVLPWGHRFANRKLLNLAEMKDECMVAMSETEFPGCHSLIVEMCRQAGFAPKIHLHAHTMTEAVAHVIAGSCITLLPESAITLPLAAEVRLVRCDAREEWYALWSATNGKPELQAVVDVLKDSSPAGWSNTLRTLRDLDGFSRFQIRGRSVAGMGHGPRPPKRAIARKSVAGGAKPPIAV